MAKQKISFDLPSNIDAEKAVLGAMIVDTSILYRFLARLSEDCFYPDNSPNQLVFKAMKRLDDAKIPCDVQTITDELIRSKELELIGGPEYLLELSETPIALTNIEEYLRIVLDHKLLRNYLVALKNVIVSYQTEKINDISEFVAEAERTLNDISEERRVGDFRRVEEIAKEVKGLIEEQRNEGGLIGLTSGYESIDRITLGFRKQDLIIVAARPSIGKTSLAVNMAFNGAISKGVPAAIFSLEMSADMLVKRLIAARGDIPLTNIMLGTLQPSDKSNLNRAVNELSNVKLYIDDTPNCKLADIIAKSRKLKTECPNLGIIVIDYIGLIGLGEKEKSSSRARQEEVAYISKSLKQLAREIDTPIMVLCQLSRNADNREDKKPQLNDLRESGQIEQDADVVMLLSRENLTKSVKRFGNKKMADIKDDEKLQAEKERQQKELFERFRLGENVDSIVVNIAKNRNGRTDDVFLHFFKNFNKFVQPTKEFIDQLKKINELTLDQINN